MRRLVHLWWCALAACSSNPLEGKELVAAPHIDDLVFDATTDATDRLVTIGMNNRHTYRLDPRSLTWEDLGVQAEAPFGPLFRDGSGNVYVYDAPDANDPPRSIRMYRLDGDTWTFLAETTRAPVARADGSLWQTSYDAGNNVSILQRYNGTTWEQVSSFPGGLNIYVDNRDDLFLKDVFTEAFYRLAATNDALELVIDCTDPDAQYCSGRGWDAIHTDDDGTFYYVVNNEITEHGGVYRISPGGAPSLVAEFPTVYDKFDMPIEGAHPFGFGFDRDGNFYMARGSNVTVDGNFYFLGAGESSFDNVMKWGHGEFTVYVPIIGRDGTVYAFNSEGPIGVIK